MDKKGLTMFGNERLMYTTIVPYVGVYYAKIPVILLILHRNEYYFPK